MNFSKNRDAYFCKSCTTVNNLLKSTSDKKTTYKKPISRRAAIMKYCIGYFWKKMLMIFDRLSASIIEFKIKIH